MREITPSEYHLVGESPNYFKLWLYLAGRMGHRLCVRILYLNIDNEQYNELLEYLLKRQLPKEADEIYEK